LSIAERALIGLLDQIPKHVKSKDCKKWKPRAEFDLIVTDPPYGFNTTEDPEALAEVYRIFLRTAVKSLKDGGQLVLALPDWSHTGRRLPAFILKDFITHQILTIAEHEGREVITSAEQITKTIPVAPYYWESEKALRRAILHFRFRKRAEYRRDSRGFKEELTGRAEGHKLQ
jgi:tRNA G10  N-methylase Trm11